jgi:hypothetical protein
MNSRPALVNREVRFLRKYVGKSEREFAALLHVDQDAIRDALRQRGRSPVMFDFDKPRTQTTLETISTLAHMSRFVIADLTDAKSVLQELMAIVPTSPSVQVQPLLLASNWSRSSAPR